MSQQSSPPPVVARAARHNAPLRGLRWAAIGAVVVSPAWLLIQGTSLPESSAQAVERMDAGASTFSKVSFEDRYPANVTFNERFAGESYTSPAVRVPVRETTASIDRGPIRVATLVQPKSVVRAPELSQAMSQEQTKLVSLQSAAFPYLGNNPRTDQPFLNVFENGRRGHRGPSGRVYWQDETYNDNRVLVHIPKGFDARKPGVIVVFFHGNGATLERDVRDRQLVPQQISDSGVNAILLAPQLAVDAIDSSAGKFWQPGGMKRFLDDSAVQLARMTGNPRAAKAFANMPVVIVGYSGGFVPTAYSLAVGGVEKRVRGVFLLDALYGELDKFASFIENNRSAFFVSAYTPYTRRRDVELMSMLKEKGIAVTTELNKPLKPGTVAFLATGEGIRHRDYVTQAWTEYPVKDVLVKMAQAKR
ncbi:MAG: alpha/beta hydrolase [Xanthobacteraceae bacterium]